MQAIKEKHSWASKKQTVRGTPMSSVIERILSTMILMLIVSGCTSGCTSEAERDLYRKITVSVEITSVTSTEYRWDTIIVEFPNGQRCRVRVPRDIYQPGDVYQKQMWKWQAIERGIIDQ